MRLIGYLLINCHMLSQAVSIRNRLGIFRLPECRLRWRIYLSAEVGNWRGDLKGRADRGAREAGALLG